MPRAYGVDNPDAAGSDASDAAAGDVSDAAVPDAFANDQAFNPDGVNEELTAADSAWQESASTHTVCFWVRASAYETDDGFIDKGATNWSWTINAANVDGSNNARIRTCVSGACGNTKCAASGGQWTTTTNVLTVNNAHFVCSVWNSANADATKIQLYLNGAAATQIQSGTAPSTMQDCSQGWTVAHGLSTHQFAGFIDEISWWNTALSAGNISTLCCGSGSCGGVCNYGDQSSHGISGLIGYWNFEGDTPAGGATDKAGGAATLTCSNCDSGDFSNGVP